MKFTDSTSRIAHIGSWLLKRRWLLLVLFVGVLIPLYVFGALADEVIERENFFFDDPILLFLHSQATPLFDRVMLFFSLIGGLFGLGFLDVGILLVLLWRQRWGDGLFWGLATVGAAVLNLLAKSLFGRLRPELWLSIAPETTFSFPSGHAMGSMAMVTALAVLAWPTRWRWPVLLLGGAFVLFVGLSRVYLGVHYPSDILAGWAASLCWVLGVSLILYRRLAKPTPQAQPA